MATPPARNFTGPSLKPRVPHSRSSAAASAESPEDIDRMTKVLVTGSAGFIGMHSTLKLLARGHEVVGIDNISDYTDVALKEARLGQLRSNAKFRFVKLDIADRSALAALFAAE